MKYIFSKHFLVLIVLFVQIQNSFSQVVIEWQKCLGGSNDDYASTISATSDGGYFVTGTTTSNDKDVSGNNGASDVWVVKVDSIGNIQWQNCLGGSKTENGLSGMQTMDGGYIVTGFTYSVNGDVSGNHSPSNNRTDVWLVKLDSAGSIQWQHCYGGYNMDVARSVQQTLDGGYIFNGYTMVNNNGDVQGYHGGFGDFWTVKTDSLGNIEWQRCSGGTDGDFGEQMQLTNDGGYVLVGVASSPNFDVTGYHGGQGDFWIVKMDSSSTIQWQKCLGGSSEDRGICIKQTQDGGYIAGGHTYSHDFDVVGHHNVASPPNSLDGWVVKVDSLGNIQWQKCLGSTTNEWIYDIMESIDGGYYVAGVSSGNGGDISGNHGFNDSWLVKIDSVGNIIWQKSLGGTRTDALVSIIKANDHGCVLAGYTSSKNGDVFANKGRTDAWIVKVTEHCNSITGRLFIDSNINNVLDSGEQFLSSKKVVESNTGRIHYSNSAGVYNLIVLDSGNFSVSPLPLTYYNVSPSARAVNFSGINQKDSLNDFAFQPISNIDDLQIEIASLGAFRAGFDAYYMVKYRNVGTTILNPHINFPSIPNVNFVSSIPIPTAVYLDSIIWSLGPMYPFQEASILIKVQLSTMIQNGSSIFSVIQVAPVSSDTTPLNNVATWTTTVTGSYDPNEMLVSRSFLTTSEVLQQPYLDYVINFQNVGTDTAFNIKILNNLPADLQAITLEFISASHPVNFQYDSYARLISFDFENILLPDSNINELASHGFVRYRIKPRTNIILGDSIKDNADIYFDYNAPVTTNFAITTITAPVGLSSTEHTTQLLQISPNPVDNLLKINTTLSDGEDYKLMIYDIIGHCIREQFLKYSSQSVVVDVSSLSSGAYIIELQNKTKNARGKFVKR